jgi:programmed cell death protein 4
LSTHLISSHLFSFQEIDAHEYSYEFVKRLINTSLDLGDHQREQASQLLSALYPDTLSMNMIGKGFERLFEVVDEIAIDAPQAGSAIAAFIARAVVDEVLPPSFLSDVVVRNLGGEVIDAAILLLSRHHTGAKLERIWGPGDGRPVAEMKVSIDQLLQEFLLSADDEEEAERCVRELQAPLFLHEVVKRAVTLGLDKAGDQQLRLSALLNHLCGIGLISAHQAEMGFNRLYQAVPDLVLDVPNALVVVDEFKNRAVAAGILNQNYQPPSAVAV